MNTKFNKSNLFARIIASPFVFCLIIIAHVIKAVVIFTKYLKYGGELITFMENERPTINDIYQELKNQKIES